MWEKINKLSVQVIIATVGICSSFGLLFMLVFKEVPANNKDVLQVLIGAVVGSTMTAVLGWLFTQNKINQKQ